jgi:hypothetical protein
MFDFSDFHLSGTFGGIAPSWMQALPDELLDEVVLDVSVRDVVMLVCAYLMSADFCFRVLKRKIYLCNIRWSNLEKSTGYRSSEVAVMIFLMNFLVETGRVDVVTATELEGGFCFVKELMSVSWMTVAFHALGEFPNPWMVYNLYFSQMGSFVLPSCNRSGCAVRAADGRILLTDCVLCLLRYARDELSYSKTPAPRKEKLLVREDEEDKLFHFVGSHTYSHVSHVQQVQLSNQYGNGKYTTFLDLMQRECFYDSRVGTPTVIDLDSEILDSPVEDRKKTEKDLRRDGFRAGLLFDEELMSTFTDGVESARRIQKSARDDKLQSTIGPLDSASCVTPRPLSEQKPNHKFSIDTERSELATQIATLTADVHNLVLKSSKTVGDYTRDEYDEDLTQAFESSGMVRNNGQLFIRPLAFTGAAELVPKITVDDRLNFLIRLHTAIFKIVPNSADYPPCGIMTVLKRATEGKLPDDHPSFDLLQIVVTDSLDWSHMMVKNNNFGLPVIEPGMRFNERIIGSNLLSLKGEYFGRWSSVVKDCILPNDITDTSRWSDSYETRSMKRITSRRPDMARLERQTAKGAYRRRRRDSILGL